MGHFFKKLVKNIIEFKKNKIKGKNINVIPM
jgi:hypothetical protein